jgi:hypothetical protein
VAYCSETSVAILEDLNLQSDFPCQLFASEWSQKPLKLEALEDFRFTKFLEFLRCLVFEKGTMFL